MVHYIWQTSQILTLQAGCCLSCLRTFMSIPLPTMGKVSPKNNTNSKSHTTGRRLWNWDWYQEQEVEIGWKLIQVGWTFKRSWQILLTQLVLQPKYTRSTYKKTTQSHKTKTASHKQGWWLGVEGRPAVSSESGCWLRAAGSGTVHCSTLRALWNTSQCAQLGRSLRAGARPA